MKKTYYLLLLLGCLLCLSGKTDGFSVKEIDDAVMARMKGKSFPAGCTTKREDLRYLTVMHYDRNGKVQQGELVCNKAIAQDLIEIFEALYEVKYPIERMRLIDDYDADDGRSMLDNNTSSFCFRVVDGTKKLSNHARGMAIDINPFYNPYVRNKGGKKVISPKGSEKWASNRSNKENKMVILRDDYIVKLFKQHGFKWGGDWKNSKDYQHFDK